MNSSIRRWTAYIRYMLVFGTHHLEIDWSLTTSEASKSSLLKCRLSWMDWNLTLNSNLNSEFNYLPCEGFKAMELWYSCAIFDHLGRINEQVLNKRELDREAYLSFKMYSAGGTFCSTCSKSNLFWSEARIILVLCLVFSWAWDLLLKKSQFFFPRHFSWTCLGT